VYFVRNVVATRTGASDSTLDRAAVTIAPAVVVRREELIQQVTVADVDFDRVTIPQKPDGERLTSKELQSAVESFLGTLRER